MAVISYSNQSYVLTPTTFVSGSAGSAGSSGSSGSAGLMSSAGSCPTNTSNVATRNCYTYTAQAPQTIMVSVVTTNAAGSAGSASSFGSAGSAGSASSFGSAGSAPTGTSDVTTIGVTTSDVGTVVTSRAPGGIYVSAIYRKGFPTRWGVYQGNTCLSTHDTKNAAEQAAKRIANRTTGSADAKPKPTATIGPTPSAMAKLRGIFSKINTKLKNIEDKILKFVPSWMKKYAKGMSLISTINNLLTTAANVCSSISVLTDPSATREELEDAKRLLCTELTDLIIDTLQVAIGRVPVLGWIANEIIDFIQGDINAAVAYAIFN